MQAHVQQFIYPIERCTEVERTKAEIRLQVFFFSPRTMEHMACMHSDQRSLYINGPAQQTNDSSSPRVPAGPYSYYSLLASLDTMASRSPTILAMACTFLLIATSLSSFAAAAAQPSTGSFEDDKVHDFLRVLDRAAAYRRECFGECAKGCYCSDNPYSCLRECMPTPPTRCCGTTYGTVQDVFSSAATFTAATVMVGSGDDGDKAGGAAGGQGFFSSAT